MENSVLMEVDEGLQDLVQEALSLFFRKWLVALLLHVLFKVEFKVLEHKIKLILRVNDFLKSKRMREISD